MNFNEYIIFKKNIILKEIKTVLNDFIVLTEIYCNLSQYFGVLYVKDERKIDPLIVLPK
jgi:hypothetical protein